MAFAIPSDLMARPSTLTDDQIEAAEQTFEDASLWLRVWFPTAAEEVLTNPDLKHAMTILCCSMVKRALIAGDREGLASYSETIDAYAEQVVLRNPDGNLYVTKAERELVETLLGIKDTGAVSQTARGL